MILIADSGSTKTEWRLITNQQTINAYATQGINPYFQSEQQISDILKSELISALPFSVADGAIQILFYGAGCGADSKKQIVKNALNSQFPQGEIEIHSDLLGAAYGMCGNSAGIVAILGTGANTCYYDGKQIAENRASLGFVLGDEGSGAHIGKTFVQAYLNLEIPQELATAFFESHHLNTSDILDAVYRKPMPNRFLAGFSKFILQHIAHPFVTNLVTSCFEQFIDKHICKYPQHKELPMYCVGSVAFHYSSILKDVANSKGVTIKQIAENPIASLVTRKMAG